MYVVVKCNIHIVKYILSVHISRTVKNEKYLKTCVVNCIK